MDLDVQTPQLHRISSGQRRLQRRDSYLKMLDGRDDRGWTSLHIAARKGDLKEVQQLLDNGADVNESSSGHKALGTTALHLAAKGGHVEVMNELLKRGANIEARTRGGCGWTPLHHAAKEKNKKAIRFLVQNGAFLPLDITDGRFNPPLHYCAGLEWAYKARDKSTKKYVFGDKSSEESSS